MKTALVLSIIALAFSVATLVFVCLAIIYGIEKLDTINGIAKRFISINNYVRRNKASIQNLITNRIEPMEVTVKRLKRAIEEPTVSADTDVQALINMILNKPGCTHYTKEILSRKSERELEEIVEQVSNVD